MRLSELTAAQLAWLYESELKSAFPPEELKPLKIMLTMLEKGRYQALGL